MKKNRIIVLFLVTIILLCCGYKISKREILNVYANELHQSPNYVEIDLIHDHDSDLCYEKKWIPCGGTWCTNFEPYYGCTVYYCSNNESDKIVNGVKLSSIHTGFTTSEHSGTHSGEYAKTLACNYEVAGRFSVEKIVTGNTVMLKASMENSEGIITDYNISWQDGTEYTDNGESTIKITHNGKYVATIKWFDSKSEKWENASLEYYDISFPIEMKFICDGVCIETKEVMYGEELPTSPQILKQGYIFDGYYDGERLLYDTGYNPISNIKVDWEQESVEITAALKPKEYNIRYGADDNNDGFPDHSLHVVYGQAYEELPLEDINLWNNSNKKVTGYGFGRNLVFDGEGKPTNEFWKWDVDENESLGQIYKKGYSNSESSENSGIMDENITTKEQEMESMSTVSANSDSLNSFSAKKQSVSNNSISNNSISIDAINNNSINNNSVSNNFIGKNSKRNNSISDNLERSNSADINSLKKKAVSSNTNISSFISDVSNVLIQNMKNDKISDGLENDKAMQDGSVKRRKLISNIAKVSLVSVGVLAVLWAVTWLYFIIFFSANVYTYEKNNKKRRTGLVIIHKRENSYFIRIPVRMYKTSYTGIFEICFSPGFLKKNINHSVVIAINSNRYTDVIKSVIQISNKYDTD